jgi:hypothetical protein
VCVGFRHHVQNVDATSQKRCACPAGRCSDKTLLAGRLSRCTCPRPGGLRKSEIFGRPEDAVFRQTERASVLDEPRRCKPRGAKRLDPCERRSREQTLQAATRPKRAASRGSRAREGFLPPLNRLSEHYRPADSYGRTKFSRDVRPTVWSGCVGGVRAAHGSGLPVRRSRARFASTSHSSRGRRLAFPVLCFPGVIARGQKYPPIRQCRLIRSCVIVYRRGGTICGFQSVILPE